MLSLELFICEDPSFASASGPQNDLKSLLSVFHENLEIIGVLNWPDGHLIFPPDGPEPQLNIKQILL